MHSCLAVHLGSSANGSRYCLWKLDRFQIIWPITSRSQTFWTFHNQAGLDADSHCALGWSSIWWPHASVQGLDSLFGNDGRPIPTDIAEDPSSHYRIPFKRFGWLCADLCLVERTSRQCLRSAIGRCASSRQNWTVGTLFAQWHSLGPRSPIQRLRCRLAW